MLTKFHPEPYQVAGIKAIIQKRKYALWLPMGLGKTAIALHALAYLIDSLRVSQTLVVAPPKVALHVWPAEVEKWEHTNWLSIQPLNGLPAKRVDMLQSPAAVHIISYGLLQWLLEQKQRPHYDCIIIDESYRIKNPSSKRYKALKKLSTKTEYVVELSGTPAPKGLQGLWSQCYLLDKGEALLPRYTHYLNRWFYNVYRSTWRIRNKECEKEIHQRIKHLAISMDTAHLDWMPKVIKKEIPVYAEDMKSYSQLIRDHIWILEEDTITAASAATLSLKLHQWANGAVYVDDKEEVYEQTHSAKLEALESVIEEAAGAPVLVYYWFKSDRARLLKHFPNATDKLDIPKWNRGSISILLLQLQAGSEGLNLQQGGNIVCFFSMYWRADYINQAIARLARKGQIHTVFAYFLVCMQTIDERILAVNRGDTEIQNALLDHVKYYGEV